MPELSPEASKLLEARKAAVAEAKALDGKERPITDHFIRRLASARLFQEALELRSIAGETISSTEFKAADAAIEDARNAIAVQKPIQVKIMWIEPCPSCHFEIELPAPGMARPVADPIEQGPRRCPACGAELDAPPPIIEPHSGSTIELRANPAPPLAPKALPAPQATPAPAQAKTADNPQGYSAGDNREREQDRLEREAPSWGNAGSVCWVASNPRDSLGMRRDPNPFRSFP